MNEISYVRYTKINGEESDRDIIVVSNPRENYLVYDVSKMSEVDRNLLLDVLKQIEEFRDNAIADFELLTEIKQSSLWRSFKPGGIDWG